MRCVAVLMKIRFFLPLLICGFISCSERSVKLTSSSLEQLGDREFSIEYSNAPHGAAPSRKELRIPNDEDHDYLDEVLSDIFREGTEDLSEEAKTIAILRYVSSALELKDNGGTATKVIKDGYAVCGGMSYAFQMLCRKAGIPARYIGGFNMRPGQGGHAISEVFLEGQWRLMDPSFALFYYSIPHYDGTGEIASFHDLVLNPEKWHAIKVVQQPWGGIYDEAVWSFAPVAAEPDYLAEVFGTSIIDLYRKYAIETFPVAYGNMNLVSFPVDVDLRTDPKFQVGEIDGDSYDMVLQALNGTSYMGSQYVGGAAPPTFHTWSIKSNGRSRVRVTYVSTSENPDRLRFVPLKAVRLSNYRVEGKQTTFDLLLIGSETIFSIYCPEGYFPVDMMEAVGEL